MSVTPPEDDGVMETLPVIKPGSLIFSASRIKTWMNCPLQGWFKYVEHYPVDGEGAKAVFGKCVHAALEYYNQTNDVNGACAMFLDLWMNPEKVGAPTHKLIWPKHNGYSFGSLKSKGVNVIRHLDQLQNWDDREVIATEHPFLVPFGEHWLHGFVDLVELKHNGKGQTILKIVDYKTSSYKPNKAELALDVQFTVYVYASRQREFWTGWPGNPDFPGLPNGEWQYEMMQTIPRRAVWYHLFGPKEIDAGPRDQADFDRLYRVCLEIARADQHQVFVPKIGDACHFCDFKEPCGVSIPEPSELAAQDAAWM